jgi:hypothetical protein
MAILFSSDAGLDEGLEQPALLGVPRREALGVELDGNEPRQESLGTLGEFGGLNEAVRGHRDRAEFGSQLIDALMMGAVHLQGTSAGDLGEDRTGIDSHRVHRFVLSVAGVVWNFRWTFGGEVEVEGSAERDIDQLVPSAHGQERSRLREELLKYQQFEDVPGYVWLTGEPTHGVRGSWAVDLRADVVAAAQQNAVGAADRIADDLDIGRGREDPGDSTGLDDSLRVTQRQADAVVIKLSTLCLGAGRDEDEGPTGPDGPGGF